MSLGRVVRIGGGLLAVLVLLAAVGAVAAANTVPPSNIGLSNTPLAIAQLLPPECAGMPISSVVYSGTGGGSNELVLGSSGPPATLSGGGGRDCIVGGSGTTTLRGQGGNDVLIGGPVLVVWLMGGGGSDTCYRGAAAFAIVISCETYIP